MKKVIILCAMLWSLQAIAQQEETGVRSGFKKERLFTGGSVNVGFSNNLTMLGITPQLGYSITNWADIGVNVNINYVSHRDYSEYGDKLRQTTYGPGGFVRLFPVSFLFGTAQYEYNVIRQKYIPANNGSFGSSTVQVQANSLLVGGGYAGGRQPGNNSYYYISVMFDIAGDKYSPYIDELGRSNPVIRAGYNIGLFQGRRSRLNN